MSAEEAPKTDDQSKNPRINYAQLEENVKDLVDNLDRKAMAQDGKEKIKLLHQDMVDVSETLKVEINFACEICKGVPMLPVQQCEQCEYLFCGTPNKCLAGLTQCPRCDAPAPEFSTSKVGRIVRNTFSTFRFKNNKTGEDEEETVSYERKCKDVI